jgi:hypothetical protein
MKSQPALVLLTLMLAAGCGPAKMLPDLNMGWDDFIPNTQDVMSGDVSQDQESVPEPEVTTSTETDDEEPTDTTLNDLSLYNNQLLEKLPGVFQYRLDDKESSARRIIYRPICIVDPVLWSPLETAKLSTSGLFKKNKTYVSELPYFFIWELTSAELTSKPKLEEGKSVVTISRLQDLKGKKKVSVTLVETFRQPLKLKLGLCKD